MPKVHYEEEKGIDEVSLTLQFSDEPAEQAFKKALLNKFAPEEQKKLIAAGQAAACVEFQTNKDGTITLQGLIQDIDARLDQIIPADSKVREDKGLIEKVNTIDDQIYDLGGKIRQQESQKSNLIRSDAHKILFKEVEVNKKNLEHEKELDMFIQSVKNNQVQVLKDGSGFHSPSGAGESIWTEESLKGIEQHKNFSSIQSKYAELKEMLEKNQQENQSKNNLDFFS